MHDRDLCNTCAGTGVRRLFATPFPCPDCTDDDEDDVLDFGMFDLPARPGPCRAASAPERDPVEARVLADRAAAQHRADALRARGAKGAE